MHDKLSEMYDNYKGAIFFECCVPGFAIASLFAGLPWYVVFFSFNVYLLPATLRLISDAFGQPTSNVKQAGRSWISLEHSFRVLFGARSESKTPERDYAVVGVLSAMCLLSMVIIVGGVAAPALPFIATMPFVSILVVALIAAASYLAIGELKKVFTEPGTKSFNVLASIQAACVLMPFLWFGLGAVMPAAAAFPPVLSFLAPFVNTLGPALTATFAAPLLTGVVTGCTAGLMSAVQWLQARRSGDTTPPAGGEDQEDQQARRSDDITPLAGGEDQEDQQARRSDDTTPPADDITPLAGGEDQEDQQARRSDDTTPPADDITPLAGGEDQEDQQARRSDDTTPPADDITPLAGGEDQQRCFKASFKVFQKQKGVVCVPMMKSSPEGLMDASFLFAALKEVGDKKQRTLYTALLMIAAVGDNIYDEITKVDQLFKNHARAESNFFGQLEGLPGGAEPCLAGIFKHRDSIAKAHSEYRAYFQSSSA